MNVIERIIRNRILQHLAFWSISFYILMRNFATTSIIVPVDLIYTCIFTIFLLLAVYTNLWLLIPAYFNRGKYGWYFLLVSVLLVSVTFVYSFGFDLIVDVIFKGYYLISYFDYWDTMKYFVIFTGISSLLHFSKSWFLYKEAETKLMQTQKEKIEAELDALKSQINPHFLFNSLNSIYSLVLKKSDTASEALIKLSDTMRYIIYESNHEKVLLQKEIEFARDYIELQKLRMSAKDTLIFNVHGKVKEQKIAPLVMIPIIENCFKYGIKGDTEASFVTINIDVEEKKIHLKTSNNIGKVDNVERVKSKGTGLSNLKKRLSLIYPEQHHLTIDQTDHKFNVDLLIDL